MAKQGVLPGTVAADIAVDLITAVPEELPVRCAESLQQIVSLSGSDSCFVVRRIAEHAPSYRILCRINRSATDMELEPQEVQGDTFAAWEPELQELKQIYIHDTHSAAPSAEIDFLRANGYRSVLVVPMLCRGYCMGFMGLATTGRTHDWDEPLRDSLRLAAEVFGNVFDRNEAEHDLAVLRRLRRSSGRKALETQEQEWRFLARELHDEIGPYLTAIKTEATLIAAKSDARRNGSEIVGHAGAIKEQAEHIYSAVHGLIRRLRSTVLDELGLEGAIRSCIADSPLMKMPVRCEINIKGDLDNIEDTVASSILKVLQECFTNIARHARASLVKVSLVRKRTAIADRRARYRHGGRREKRALLQQDSLILKVSDDGCGMDVDPLRPGMGLLGIRERIEALGGQLHINSAPGLGMEIGVVIDLSVTNGSD